MQLTNKQPTSTLMTLNTFSRILGILEKNLSTEEQEKIKHTRKCKIK